MKIAAKKIGKKQPEKKKIYVHPMEGIAWENKRVNLGDSRAQVVIQLGEGDFFEGSYYYFDSELAIMFDKEDRVKFIEFLGGGIEDALLCPYVFGQPVFQAKSSVLFLALADKDGGKAVESDDGHAFTFENLCVRIYRDYTPADVENYEAELKAGGVDLDGMGMDSVEAWQELTYQKQLSEHWSTIGIYRK